MRRTFSVFALAALCSGCFNEINPAQPAPLNQATDSPTPQEASSVTTQITDSTEVLIVSKPDGAKILSRGAVIGSTPMELRIIEETNLVLELEGYTRQAVILTPQSKPNLVVELVPEPVLRGVEALKEPEPQAALVPITPKRPAAKTTTEPRSPEKAAATSAPAQEPPPSPEPVSPTPKADKPKDYKTMRELKQALRDGVIDRAGYAAGQKKIRERRAAEFEQIKADYSAGKIDKAAYKELSRQIKLKYEG